MFFCFLYLASTLDFVRGERRIGSGVSPRFVVFFFIRYIHNCLSRCHAIVCDSKCYTRKLLGANTLRCVDRDFIVFYYK